MNKINQLSYNLKSLFSIVFQKLSSEKTILIISIGISLLGVIYHTNNGTNLAFNDAKSHLNIARRVVDSTNPGLAQLGSSWLPLLHLLMIPFVWNDYLWHSGFAGSFINIIAFIFASLFIYKIVYILTKNQIASSISSLIYILNPNALYMQTTGMTEILYTSMLTGSVYFLLKWYKSNDLSSLILSATFVLLTSLTRYEGWALVGLSIPIVFLLTLEKYRKRSKAEGLTILFGVVAISGILSWLMWQWVIFGHPLYFLHNEFSAVGQTKVAVSLGFVPSYHKLDIAFLSFWFAVANTAGTIIMSLWTISVLPLLFLSIKRKCFPEYLILILLTTPFIFELYTLYSGTAPINVIQIYPHTSFNVRFGLYLFPSVAIFVAYFLWNSKFWIRIILTVLIISQYYFLFTGGPIATLTEEGVANSKEQREVVAFFKNSYGGVEYWLVQQQLIQLCLIVAYN